LTERTKEELLAELELLEKANLERKIAEAKKEKEEAEALRKKEEEEQIREQLREEEKQKLMDEMSTQTTTQETQPETLQNTNSKVENFRQNVIKKYGLTGLKYEDLIKKVVDEGYKW
jgi:hypothetical protein